MQLSNQQQIMWQQPKCLNPGDTDEDILLNVHIKCGTVYLMLHWAYAC